MGKCVVEVSGCHHTALAVWGPADLQGKVYFVAASAASQTLLIQFFFNISANSLQNNRYDFWVHMGLIHEKTEAEKISCYFPFEVICMNIMPASIQA
jgi:hypothetical protein